MSSDIKQVMSQVIAQLCYQVGFDRIHESALDLLVDVGEQYIRSLACTVAKVSSLYDEAARLEDGLLALELFRQSPHTLLKFIEEVGPFFSAHPVNGSVPLTGRVCLNVPPKDHEELKYRPEYIPEHLPLNFTGHESIDTRLTLTQKKLPESPVSVAECGQSEPKPSAMCKSTSNVTTTASRVLPVWAQQTSYRIARISIDPVTKTLVEHAPPEKVQDLSPELTSLRGYGINSGTSIFSDAPKLDTRIDTQRGLSSSSVSSVSYRQGATDEQWAAALQATAVARPAKRIVYTPSRFDPSVVPTSSMKRSNSTVVFSNTNRRFSGSKALDTTKKKSAHGMRPTSNTVPKITTTTRRRRGTFGRARRWARRRNLKKSSTVKDLPCTSQATQNKETPEPSPPAEKTPELKDLHHSPSPVLQGYNDDQADSGSDRTPPATSPLAALRMRKINHSESPTDVECLAPTCESVVADVKTEEVLRDQTTDDRASVPIPSLATEADSSLSMKSDSPQKSPPPETQPSPPMVTEQTEERMNAAPVSLPSPVRARLRGPRKGRGCRRPAARTSIISSLFQNPLRKKAVARTPNATKPNAIKATLPEERISNTTSSHTITSAIEAKDDPDIKPPVATPASKDYANKSTRLRGKRAPSPLGKPSWRKDISDKKKTQSDQITPQSSPASDSTEPMLDIEKANLLLMPTNPLEKSIFDSSSASILSTPVKLHPQKIELNSLPFPGKNFDKPRNLAPIAVRALPSSPSSLESSPTSSLSSTSTSLLEGLVTDHAETRESTSIVSKESIMASEETEWNEAISNSMRSNARFPSVEVSKEAHSIVDDVSPSLSSSSSLTASTASTVTSSSLVQQNLLASGPPPLLPLNKQPLDVPVTGSSLSSFNNTVSNAAVVPPPSLVSVTELPTSPAITVRPSLPATGTGSHTSSTSVPSNTSGGLRIKIRFGASEVRESVASSLSPSSSSLSSGSSPSSPYITERMPAPVRDLSTSSPHRMAVTPKDLTSSSTMDLKPTGASLGLESMSATKTPKLVIRLGANNQSSNQTRAQPPMLWSTEKLNSDNVKGQQMPSILEARSQPGGSSTSIPPPPPPPLQLTISRDRLNYRGRTASNASDSNVSSSSGTESLLSSGDDDESIGILSKHSTLPPPPSLERLPNRGETIDSSSTNLHLAPDVTNRITLPRSNQASCSVETVASTSAHTQLPPLLPLFSSVPVERSTAQSVGTPPHLPAIDGFPTGNESGPPSSQSISSSRKKRQRSTGKRTGSSYKQRLIAAEPLAHGSGNPMPAKCDVLSGPPSRVRVDSVFTDNESDDNGVSPMPDLVVINSGTRTSQDQLKPIRNATTIFSQIPSKIGTVTKHNRTQPRTKHTASNPKPPYPPAIKTVPGDSPEPTISRDRPGRKHLTSSSSSTGSSSAKSRVTGGSHRPSSQIVVASAGSSYYFNSSGEQIWLCPICLLEDDGNLMIGCDSCDDWYHSTCLGLSAEPEDPHWFCPRCAGQPLPVNAGSIPNVSCPVQLPPLLTTPTHSNANKRKSESRHRSTPGSNSKHTKRGTKR